MPGALRAWGSERPEGRGSAGLGAPGERTSACAQGGLEPEPASPRWREAIWVWGSCGARGPVHGGAVGRMGSGTVLPFVERE